MQGDTLITPITPAFRCIALWWVEMKLVSLPQKALTRYTTGMLWFIVQCDSLLMQPVVYTP